MEKYCERCGRKVAVIFPAEEEIDGKVIKTAIRRGTKFICSDCWEQFYEKRHRGDIDALREIFGMDFSPQK